MIKVATCTALAVLLGICAAEPLPRHALTARASVQGPQCPKDPPNCTYKLVNLEPFNTNLIRVSDFFASNNEGTSPSPLSALNPHLPHHPTVPLSLMLSRSSTDVRMALESTVNMRTNVDATKYGGPIAEARGTGRSQNLGLVYDTTSPKDHAPLFCRKTATCAIVWQQKMQTAHFENECTLDDGTVCTTPGAKALELNFAETDVDGTVPRGRYIVCYERPMAGEVPCSKALTADKDIYLNPV